MILKAARILPYRLKDYFLGGKDRPGKSFGQILLSQLAFPAEWLPSQRTTPVIHIFYFWQGYKR